MYVHKLATANERGHRGRLTALKKAGRSILRTATTFLQHVEEIDMGIAGEHFPQRGHGGAEL